MALLDAFSDERYVRVDGKPVFVIYRPLEIPDLQHFLRQWRELAAKYGLPGMHFIAYLLPSEMIWDYRGNGFDAAVIVSSHKAFSMGAWEILRHRIAEGGRSSQTSLVEPFMAYLRNRIGQSIRRVVGGFRNMVRYEDAMLFLLDWRATDPDVYPCVTPNWDNTPRSGYGGVVLHDSTPELFAVHLRQAISMVARRPPEHRLVFAKSWNEWAEGNYLEPDTRFGHQYLRVVREAIYGTNAE
jgi:hypothetical protein